MPWILGLGVAVLAQAGPPQTAPAPAPRRPLVHFLELDRSCPGTWLAQSCSALGIRVKMVTVGGTKVDLSAVPERIGQQAVRGIFVAMPQGTAGVELDVRFVEGGATESVRMAAETCDDAVAMAALLINRRLKSLSRARSPLPTLDLARFAWPAPPIPSPAGPEPAAGRRPSSPEPGPESRQPVERPVGSIGAQAWFGRDLQAEAPGVLGGELRGGLRPVEWLELGLCLGGGWLATTPVEEPKVEGFVLTAALRAGPVWRLGRLDLGAALGLGTSLYFLRVRESGYRFQHGWLPGIEAILAARFDLAVDLILEAALGWSPWMILAMAGDRGRVMEIGGLRLLLRIGVAIDLF